MRRLGLALATPMLVLALGAGLARAGAPLPPGCTAPPAAVAVAEATLVARDTQTARFDLILLRAGTLEGRRLGDLFDVRYGDDVRYLDVGEDYLVGMGVDPVDNALHSKVQFPAPRFGGNQVVGINDLLEDCPEVEDTIITRHADGRPVDTGLFQPFVAERDAIVWAVIKPLAAVLAVLVALVLVKNILWWITTATGRAVERGREYYRRPRFDDQTGAPSGAPSGDQASDDRVPSVW